ncbi:UNVERIFIED_CONTAM: hypothetical protein FKN15_012325 [Acipenser sinensis]
MQSGEHSFTSCLCEVASLRWGFWREHRIGIGLGRQSCQLLLIVLQRTLLAQINTCRAGLCPPEAGSSLTSTLEFLVVEEEAGSVLGSEDSH